MVSEPACQTEARAAICSTFTQNKTHIKPQRVAVMLLADLLSRRLRSAGALICYSATDTWWHCGVMALEGEARDWGWRRSHHLTLAGLPTAALPSLTSGDFERSERCRVNQQLSACTSLPNPVELESHVVGCGCTNSGCTCFQSL